MAYSRISPPSNRKVKELAQFHNISLTEEELEVYSTLLQQALRRIEVLDDLESPRPETRYLNRKPGHQPSTDEDPNNVFITKCDIEGASTGTLQEYEVALKDNIAVRGVRMTNGSRAMSEYVPSFDATIVTRLLDAGATITGKLNMGDMALQNNELASMGPPVNPRDSNYLTGGSSSGSAVAVVNGDVDIAIGGDQGGSIRYPAAWNGCVGLKPTFGLVPYTGIVSASITLDHVGPMATNVPDCALVLDAISGTDEHDPRQCDVPTQDYFDALSGNPDDFTIGILEEGFGGNNAASVDACVEESIEAFRERGAEIEIVSIPFHLEGETIGWALSTHEYTELINSDGVGRFLDGFYDLQFLEMFARLRRTSANDFPPRLKVLLLTGQYMLDEYRGKYYAKAQNLRQRLRGEYENELEDVDVLVMPTIPRLPPEVTDDPTLEEGLEYITGTSKNTFPFNLTGNPAISVPCGSADGLPVGLQFVGRRFDDATVLDAAFAFERTVDWQNFTA